MTGRGLTRTSDVVKGRLYRWPCGLATGASGWPGWMSNLGEVNVNHPKRGIGCVWNRISERVERFTKMWIGAGHLERGFTKLRDGVRGVPGWFHDVVDREPRWSRSVSRRCGMASGASRSGSRRCGMAGEARNGDSEGWECASGVSEEWIGRVWGGGLNPIERSGPTMDQSNAT